MNEKFLDKFFKIFSVISVLFAKHTQLEQFLISSYYMNAPLLYTYEYIDFNLYYCKSMGVIKSNLNFGDVINFMSTVIAFDTNTDIPIAIFLYEIYNKINYAINSITEKDILSLNEYYKKLNGLS